MTWPRVSAGASRLAVARLPMKTAPTATPLTTVAARNRGIDAAEIPATIKASAARNTVSPASITGRVGSRDPPSWMQAATAKARKTTAPATAWLVSCSTPTRNVGTSALKSPSRENAAKPAKPAAMNAARPCCGMPSPRNLRDSAERALTVSGTTSRPSPATATSPSWTTKGSTVGLGAYWASSPASSGPRARPPRLAAEETRDARRPAPGDAVSVSAAVAVPVINPPDEQPADVRREDERHRADDAQADRRRQHRTPANLIGRTPGEQQGGEHGDRVRGEDQRDEAGREVPLPLVDHVQRGRQGGAEHRDRERVGNQPERGRAREPPGGLGRGDRGVKAVDARPVGRAGRYASFPLHR